MRKPVDPALAQAKAALLAELRAQGISDPRVLAAMERIPRDAFVPDLFKKQAWENTALPIARGQTISQPFIVAAMSQALEVTDRMRVLEIGTGSGYQAAILCRLGRRVYTIERHRPLLKEAEALLHKINIWNFTAIVGDGTRGWPEQAPFDRIMVTATAEEVPGALVDQLADGGIMVLPVGDARKLEQQLVRLRKIDGVVSEEVLMPVRFVPLVPGALPDGV